MLFANHGGENLGAYSKENLKAFATDLGLDSAAFGACLDSGKYTQRVQEQTSMAQQLGVRSTPSFVVNGQPVVGAQPFATFQQMIEQELDN